MARDADVAIPSVPESEADAERTIRSISPKPAPRLAVERWAKRMQVFQEMLARLYGSSPPREMSKVLEEIHELVPRIVATRAASVDEQRVLGTIEEKGREGRQRFGFAVDALGLDTSKAKDEVRVVEAHVATVRERTAQAAARYLASHTEILRWEGRSAFVEPYADLAEAYRHAATTVDAWIKAKEDERKAVALRESNERAVTDLEYQIQALRTALATHEKEIEAERSVCEKQMIKLGKQADQLEAELLGLAIRFCEPLRNRPELSPFFEQLEADVAA
jgi:serine/threonine-protein kinase